MFNYRSGLPAEDGGTEELDTSEGSSEEGCLSDEMALRLARLGLQLDRAFGGARDVEWAVAEVSYLCGRPTRLESADRQWLDFLLFRLFCNHHF